MVWVFSDTSIFCVEILLVYTGSIQVLHIFWKNSPQCIGGMILQELYCLPSNIFSKFVALSLSQMHARTHSFDICPLPFIFRPSLSSLSFPLSLFLFILLSHSSSLPLTHTHTHTQHTFSLLQGCACVTEKNLPKVNLFWNSQES